MRRLSLFLTLFLVGCPALAAEVIVSTDPAAIEAYRSARKIVNLAVAKGVTVQELIDQGRPRWATELAHAQSVVAAATQLGSVANSAVTAALDAAGPGLVITWQPQGTAPNCSTWDTGANNCRSIANVVCPLRTGAASEGARKTGALECTAYCTSPKFQAVTLCD